MSSKAQKLLRTGSANMANSLGQSAAAKPMLTLVPGPTGPDRYAGRTKGNAGEMAIDNIIPDPEQPRTDFDEAELEQLAASMKSHGQLQPIRIRWSADHGKWVVIAGERRYRAAKMAGIPKLACVFVEQEISADNVLEEQLIENAIRSDLKPVEQARAYRRLMDMKGWTGRQVAERLQLHPTSVTRALQLLDLPEQVQEQIEIGDIAPSVGVEISKIADAAEQVELAQQIVNQGMTRSEATATVQSKKAQGQGRGAKKTPAKTKAKAKVKPSQLITYKTQNRCIVTLCFPEMPTPDDIRQSLEEVLAGLGQ